MHATCSNKLAQQGDLGAQMDLASPLMKGRFGWRWIPRGFRLAWRAATKVVALESEMEAARRSEQSFSVISGTRTS